jgi:FMN reductase
MNAAKRISIVTVVGSSRPASYTAKAVTLVDDEIHKHQRFDLETIDLATISLPFPGAAGDDAVVKGVQEKVRRAAGVILATPEYHGSFSSAVKLFIENLGFPSGLARKPVALLGRMWAPSCFRGRSPWRTYKRCSTRRETVVTKPWRSASEA